MLYYLQTSHNICKTQCCLECQRKIIGMSVLMIAVCHRWSRRRTLQIWTQEAVTQEVIQMTAELLEVSTKLVAQ